MQFSIQRLSAGALLENTYWEGVETPIHVVLKLVRLTAGARGPSFIGDWLSASVDSSRVLPFQH